jgi:PDZ domain-containing protein
MNDGLYAPGVALPVAPMVDVPPPYRHTHAGSFYLVTVISQAPITTGAWVLGHVDPAIQIVPPEIVTPRNTSPQQQAGQEYQMLDISEQAAMAVGLRLAGYPQVAVGKGAQVVSVLPGSRANGVLQLGDVITAINGAPVHLASDVISMVAKLPQGAALSLQLLRGSEELSVEVPLMPPATSGGPPRIGIAIQDAGFDFHPPFPISIVTQKIDGGPSAGLVFTLTVYNALTAQDLTGGRKIAGTGTISLDGTVGPIGGVKQ